MIYLVCGLFGLVIGSFLNVVIYRLPRRESLSHPPSHCPSCGAPVRPRDNIPVFSWVLLRGRCRDCRTPIAIRYPLVEAITCGLFLGAAARFGARAELADFCVFLAVLVAISGIDIDHHLVPNRIVYPAAGANLVLLTIASAADGRWRGLEDAVIGGAIGYAALFVIHFIAPRGMGFGDVRLAGLIGLNVGWLGVAHVPVALFAGFLLGALVGVALMALGRAGRRTRVPFAPFLAAGAAICVFWGTTIVRWWLGG
ncbi:MAG TPA: prepilin peptidase [Acidimicrobiales bacterium]|nr:prepilin peptidase [Acidimicrobiales bacterium]